MSEFEIDANPEVSTLELNEIKLNHFFEQLVYQGLNINNFESVFVTPTKIVNNLIYEFPNDKEASFSKCHTKSFMRAGPIGHTKSYARTCPPPK